MAEFIREVGDVLATRLTDQRLPLHLFSKRVLTLEELERVSSLQTFEQRRALVQILCAK